MAENINEGTTRYFDVDGNEVDEKEYLKVQGSSGQGVKGSSEKKEKRKSKNTGFPGQAGE